MTLTSFIKYYELRNYKKLWTEYEKYIFLSINKLELFIIIITIIMMYNFNDTFATLSISSEITYLLFNLHFSKIYMLLLYVQAFSNYFSI